MSKLDKLLEDILEVADWSPIGVRDHLPQPNLYQNLRELKKVISQSSLDDVLKSLDNLEAKLVDFWLSQGQCPNCECPLNFQPEVGYADFGDLIGLNPFRGNQIAKCPDCKWEDS